MEPYFFQRQISKSRLLQKFDGTLLTLYQLVSSDDILFKQFGPDQA